MQQNNVMVLPKTIQRMEQNIDAPAKNFGWTANEFNLLRQKLVEQNDMQCIEHIFKKHNAQALANLRRKGCDLMQAEDIWSEILARLPNQLSAQNELGNFRIHYGNLKSLLDLMCEREWYRVCQRNERESGLDISEMELEGDTMDLSISQQLVEALRLTREALCNRCAAILQRVTFEEDRIVDIWEELKYASVGAANVHLTDCRSKFRKHFMHHYAYFLTDLNIKNNK
jgi:hypothetical protein